MDIPTTSGSAVLIPQKTKKEKVQAVLLPLIAVGYIGYLGLSTVGRFLMSLLSCFAGCNELTSAFDLEWQVSLVLFILSIVAGIFLVKKRIWARIIYIVLGLAIISTPIFIFYTTGSVSLMNTLLSVKFFWIPNSPFILVTAYLLISGMTNNWASTRKAVIIGLIIAAGVVLLQAYNIFNQHAILYSYYKGKAEGYSVSSSAGQTYTNTLCGFEITFPWSILVEDSSSHYCSDLRGGISINIWKNSGGFGPTSNSIRKDEFLISISNRYPNSPVTLDERFDTWSQYPEYIVSRGDLNGISYVKKLNKYPNGGGREEYFFQSSTFDYSISFGGSDSASLEKNKQVMQTFKLLK